MHQFGVTRSVRRQDHAVLTADTFVRAALPGMKKAVAIIHAAPAIGAGFTRYTAELDRTSDVHVGGADSFRHWMFGQPFAVGELESRTRQNPYRQRCTVFGSSPRSRIYRRAG